MPPTQTACLQLKVSARIPLTRRRRTVRRSVRPPCAARMNPECRSMLHQPVEVSCYEPTTTILLDGDNAWAMPRCTARKLIPRLLPIISDQCRRVPPANVVPSQREGRASIPGRGIEDVINCSFVTTSFQGFGHTSLFAIQPAAQALCSSLEAAWMGATTSCSQIYEALS